MYHDDINWSELKDGILKTVHPPKPVYRQIGWRNGRKLFVRSGSGAGSRFRKIHRNSELGLRLQTGDPGKMEYDRKVNRFFRVVRRSTQWYDREGKSFFASLFGI